MLLHPERPGGKPIDAAAWRKAVATCEQDRGNFTVEALLKKSGTDWRFDLPVDGKLDACATDTIVGEGVLKARSLPIELILSED